MSQAASMLAVLGASMLAALGTSILSGCGEGAESSCGPSAGTVARVIDGDTIELSDGQRVRYLLLDAPEVSSGGECYGQEAKAYNEQLVGGQSIRLTYDEAQCRDRYDRLLAYVTVAAREVNTLLVERGYACVLFIPPAGEDRREELEAVEYEARLTGRGLWGEGVCDERPCGD